MRILAIRGCNLASLAGEFELDLARAPFHGAGVFAIVGNTGAGKSTLLDALCVALFDRTPRLTNHSRVVVGRGDDDPGALGAQDARTLLRRGVAAGWAEVDFESGDARRYRARWSVRRARGQATGALQDQQITLRSLDGDEQFSGTKTETLRAIVARLGLSFDQFRRSALLAQGEFAAFLRADGKDRSELLERMTGTSIYSRLSVAAHLRATLAEHRLRDSDAAVLAIAVLADDARGAAETDRALADAAKLAARERLAHAEAAARWRDDADARTRALAAAEADHAAAIAAAEAAIALRQELALRRRADKLRGPWDAAARADRSHALAHGDVVAAREASERAAAAAAAVAASRRAIGELHEPIRAARIAAGLVERAAAGTTDRAGPGDLGSDLQTIELAAGARGRRREHGIDRSLGGGASLDDGLAPAIAKARLAGIDRSLGGGASLDDGLAPAIAKARLAGIDRSLGGGASLDDGLAPAIAKARLAGIDRSLGGGASLDDGLAPAIAKARLAGIDRSLGGGASLDDGLAPAIAKARLAGIDRSLDDGASLDDGLAPAIAKARLALDDARWLAARPAIAGELAAWPEIDAKFAQHASSADAIAAIDRALAGHAATRAQLVATHALVAAEHQAASAGLAEAQRKAQAYQQRRPLSLDAARRAEEQSRARLVEVERLVAIAAGARQAVRARGEIDRQLAELVAGAALDDAHRIEAAAARELAAMLRGERTQALAELRRAAGHAHARTELRAGEPCPLCGAVEHPWRDRGALDEVIASAQHRLDEACLQVDAASTALAALAARAQHRAREADRLASHRGTTDASAVVAVATWREHLAALGELLLEGDPASAAAERLAADREAAAKQHLDAARDTRRHAEASAKAAADAQAEAQLAQIDVDQLTARIAELARALADLDTTIERLRGERNGRADRRGELDAALRAALTRWLVIEQRRPGHAADARRGSAGDASRDSAEALPGRRAAAARGSAETLPGDASRDSAEAFPGRRAAADASRVSAETPPGQGADASRVSAETPPGQGADASRDSAETSPRRRADPDARGAGETCEPVEVPPVDDRARARMAELAAAWRTRCDRVGEAEAVLASALAWIERAASGAERAVAEHAVRLGEATRRRAEAIAELATATALLEHARGASGFDAEELARLLAGDDGRADELAEQLAELDRAIDRTRAIVGERGQLVGEHAAVRPAEPALADAAALPALAAQADAAEHHAAQLAAALAADADARDRRAAALARHAEGVAAAEVDRVLGEVIGSHDGKLFRSFAQSLTLDGLLAVANAHLEELAPRYQLERVPGHDLELQVIDRDLGDEVRSVQSLSGGESFLVSLALALGLSSMSAHDVRVRTLLIDEGFGSLDPATLDGALAVLDALQSTGRQVGVISHVPALVERVGAHVRVVQRGGGRSEVVISS